MYGPFPACEAVTLQAPAAIVVSELPFNVHTSGVVAVRVTTRPEVEVAVKVVVVPTYSPEIEGKVMLCPA